MADRHHNVRTVETYRMLTEERIQHLLDNVENAASLDTIKGLIYDFKSDEFQIVFVRHAESIPLQGHR